MIPLTAKLIKVWLGKFIALINYNVAKFLDFVFPPVCSICNTHVFENGQMCHDCWSQFNWISNQKCDICGYPFPANIDIESKLLCPICAAGENELDKIRAACVYDDFSKNIMLPFKHCAKLKYKNIMTSAMINSVSDLQTDFDVVLPVPLSRRRIWKRGYNQAGVLARPIAKHFGVKIEYDGIVRQHRKDMGHKNFKERRKNIRGVFTVVNKNSFKDKNVLIVDDVMTTGATFAELNKVLKKCGAKSVCGIVFCRAVNAI